MTSGRPAWPLSSGPSSGIKPSPTVAPCGYPRLVASGVQISTCAVGTPDGRVLTVDRADVPGGFPVLVHAGSPGSRRMLPLAVEGAAERGLRMISYDRPGRIPGVEAQFRADDDHGSTHDGHLAEACDWLRRQI